jgi:hypothetical protein
MRRLDIISVERIAAGDGFITREKKEISDADKREEGAARQGIGMSSSKRTKSKEPSNCQRGGLKKQESQTSVEEGDGRGSRGHRVGFEGLGFRG